MINPITYEANGESGSYHINSYLDYITGDGYTGDDKAALIDIVEKLYIYCVSADAYRASVVGN